MATVNILRIVVASPGDVAGERKAVEEVTAELNRSVAADRNLRLEVSRWETDAYPGFHVDGPQGLIDPIVRIKDCDLLIGIFWKRFGTPAMGEGGGTEHEFREAHKAWKECGRPQIMFYFNEKPFAPKTKSETDQWGKVLHFKQSFPKDGLWWAYKGRPQFTELLRGHLTNLIRQGQSTGGGVAKQPAFDKLIESHGESAAELVGKEPLTSEQMSECFKSLGVEVDHIPKAMEWANEAIVHAKRGTALDSGVHSLVELLGALNGNKLNAERASRFFEGYLDCLAPSRVLTRCFYLSVSKISQMFRAIRLPASESSRGVETSVEEKFYSLHRNLTQRELIRYLPARLLLGEKMAADPQLVMYFKGRFKLRLSEEFFLRFPQARKLLVADRSRDLYGLVTEVFQHPDPLAYALVQFDGSLSGHQVLMVLSRKHIAMGSMVATNLCHVLAGQTVDLVGFSIVQGGADGLELHPLVCAFAEGGIED